MQYGYADWSAGAFVKFWLVGDVAIGWSGGCYL